MKTIKLLILMSLLALSGIATAKVTMEDVNRDTEALNANVPDQAALQAKLESDWINFNNPPNEIGNKSSYVTYSLHPNSDTVKTKTLKPTSTYICALSKAGGYYRRGLKGFEAKVTESGSNWLFSVGKDCGGCDNWASAVCWTK
ncbi:hypothetical protein [Photobacterium indicum]|uniref:hypothetical protein n=1 Tax=Photobacterium indicum TaxID=81447 RepID=UPI003D14EDDC